MDFGFKNFKFKLIRNIVFQRLMLMIFSVLKSFLELRTFKINFPQIAKLVSFVLYQFLLLEQFFFNYVYKNRISTITFFISNYLQLRNYVSQAIDNGRSSHFLQNFSCRIASSLDKKTLSEHFAILKSFLLLLICDVHTKSIQNEVISTEALNQLETLIYVSVVL